MSRSRSRGLRRGALVGPALVCLGGCSGFQSALDAQGAPAEHLLSLITLITLVCAAVWLAVVAMLIIALVRRRKDGPPFATEPRQERRMMIVVTASVGATVLIISGFTLLSFFTTRALTLPAADALTIRVRALQWWWEVEYLSGAAAAPFSTANELRIPVGRPVRLLLEGGDVIHSFWVPSLAGKQDLVPGRPNELMLRAERAGVYRGQCAEFCGLQHAHMSFFVIAETPTQFDAWARGQAADAQTPTDGEAQRGLEVFLAKPCAACHRVRGTAASGANGPDLTHVGGRHSIAAGLLPTTRGSLAAWIADPQTLKPGNNMPLVPLTPEELRALSAYMASLR